MAENLVRCRRCAWVHIVATPGMGYTHCGCGTPGSRERMEPTDGAEVPLGSTLNGIVLADPPPEDHYERRQAERRLRPVIDISVRGYVEAYVEGTAPDYVKAFVITRLGVLPETNQELVADMVAENVEALHEGNHIAFGIPRALADRYFARRRSAR